jgi:zinc finger protein
MAALPVGDGWQQGDEDDISEIHNCFCPNCHEGKAKTLMLPTRVPGFREIVIMAIDCPDCGFRNSEVNFGGEIQTQGSRITLTVTCPEDLNRQVLKSDSSTLVLPSLQLEIPPGTQRGTLTTIEGMISRAEENLSLTQPERLKLGDVDNFHRCKAVIDKIKKLLGTDDDSDDDDDEEEEKENNLLYPFDIIVDDIAGNSFIENPNAPTPDPHLKVVKYTRTPNQDMSLGLQPSADAVKDGKIEDNNPKHKNVANATAPHAIDMDTSRPGSVGRQEVIKFQTTCTNCFKPAETDMCVTDIPHFKEVIIMCLVCDYCGFKSNEIKAGGAIPKYGAKITLTATSEEDLAREVLKSDTAGIEIPEIELFLDEGGLDGVYTTVEGLIQKMRERLTKANPFGSGDSALKQHTNNDGGAFSEPSSNYVRYQAFLEKLRDLAEGRAFPFTLIISDPLANSFVGPIPKDAIALSYQAETEGSSACYESYVDLGMHLEEYERTHDQNEILGLNDIKTEGYTGDTADTANYGTDKMAELPDRISRLDVRGPDHPHEVGKAPIEGDTTVMGAKSANFSVPSMGQRGTVKAVPVAGGDVTAIDLRKLVRAFEQKDDGFMMNDEYDGPREGRVYKYGAQGQGYYKDVPLVKLWEDELKSL